MTHEVLRELPLFAGLSEEDISLLEEGSSQFRLAEGEVLLREGTPSGSLYVILEGEFEILKRAENRDVLLAVRGPGEVIGEMSLLDQTPRSATVRAACASLILEIDQEAFRHLVAASPSAALSILRTVTSRLRNTESMLRQSEKMAALGTLAAGLAHELNNPSAALARAAEQLEDALRTAGEPLSESPGAARDSGLDHRPPPDAPQVQLAGGPSRTQPERRAPSRMAGAARSRGSLGAGRRLGRRRSRNRRRWRRSWRPSRPPAAPSGCADGRRDWRPAASSGKSA